MLKYRVILGLLLSAGLVGLLALDSYAGRGWPVEQQSLPPGLFLALACLIVIPLGLREMGRLLARENVTISMRITAAAAILCMLWPWAEQVCDSLYQQDQALHAAQGADASQRIAQAQMLEGSPWFSLGRVFRSVKPHYLVPTILALSLVAAVVKHSRHRRVDGAMANAGGTLLAIVYLGVLPGFYLPICMTHSAWMVLATVAVVKCADIGAFSTGRLIGRHKLIPWLSPGKTVEGFFGGLLLSGVLGAGIALYLQATRGGVGGDSARWAGVSQTVAIAVGAGSGILLGAAGQLGDLLESLLKRDAGVKDSGGMPGFGGVLDILDSPLLAAPVAYWLLKIVLPPPG